MKTKEQWLQAGNDERLDYRLPKTLISVFATFGEERRHKKFATRKAAADGIRDARCKVGRDINVFDPWTKKREAHNR